MGSLNAAALALRPFTIVRTHVKWIYRSDQTAALEDFGGAVAMAVASERAVAAGIGSIPNPFGNADSNAFFVYDTYYGLSGAASDLIPNTQFIVTNSKGMRKVSTDEQVAIVVENLALNGSTMGCIGRILVKLH